MARTDTLPHFLTDVAEAIRTKGGTSETIQASAFDTAIANLPSGGGSGYTGHYDSTGLTQMGWTTEDIKYYQDNAVIWNTEQDSDYEVRADEITGGASTKTRYILKSTTLTTFRNYSYLLALPNLSISKTDWSYTFGSCFNLLTIPSFNMSNATSTEYMFTNCYNLITIPELNTSNVTSMRSMFNNCYGLKTMSLIDTSNNTSMREMFKNCYCLHTIPLLNTAKVTSMYSTFNGCLALVSVPVLDTSKVTDFTSCFANCTSLSDDSLNNILQMCINATSYAGTKSLYAMGIDTSLYYNRITSCSNYQAFLSAGWVIQ